MSPAWVTAVASVISALGAGGIVSLILTYKPMREKIKAEAKKTDVEATTLVIAMITKGLEDTRQELATTRKELSDARQEIRSLRIELRSATHANEQLQYRIASLEQR